MKPIKIVSTQKPNVLMIRWDPNNVCNYKCQYCWPSSNAGDYHSPLDLDLIIRNVNHLIKMYVLKQGITKIHLCLAGGEPTLWKDLGKFIDEIKKENDIYFTIISNGSRTLRWWEEYGHLIDNAHLSYHIAQADPDHMIAVADTLFKYNKKVTVKIMMDRKHWQTGLDIINYMKKKSKYSWFIMTCEVIEENIVNLQNIKIINADDIQLTKIQKLFLKNPLKRIPNILWLWKNRKLIFEGQVRLYESVAHFENGKTVKSKSNTYINNNWNTFEGWSCDIGLNNVYIGWNGDIKGACDQTIYGLDHRSNILDTNFVAKFDPDFKPSVCSKKNCVCSPETHVSKFKLS
jgi:MoaA/NifB/PqqE/SkfB family radical SAM enzyme